MATPVISNVTEELILWLRKREQKGWETYHSPFNTFMGKEPAHEALEEALDLVQYLFALKLESRKLRELFSKRVGISRVYVAGPYTGDGSEVAKRDNTNKAIHMFHELMDRGFKPFCPHLSHFADLVKTRPYQDWLDLDLVWLAVCDALYLIPGSSPGAKVEVGFCKSVGIPVFTDMEALSAASSKVEE
jgi:pentatricopeptide repeat protein